MFNKFPFYRILVLFTLFSMSLTACNAAPTLTAPESTSTPTPQPTETQAPVPTPTETNTPVPMSSLEQSVIGLLDEMKVNYTKTNENGVITLVNNETGKDIMRNGRVEISIAVELAKKDCEPTDIEPDKRGFIVPGTEESLAPPASPPA